VVAGCDPALPLLETPLGLLDPPPAFAWWPCGSGEALRLAASGLVHAAGVHRADLGDGSDLRDGTGSGAIAGGLADAGVSSEPAALAYGLDFIPLAQERFDLLLPAKHAASREVQGLLKVLTSPWLLAELVSLSGYDAACCGERA
jgi:molybdate-binding protein